MGFYGKKKNTFSQKEKKNPQQQQHAYSKRVPNGAFAITDDDDTSDESDTERGYNEKSKNDDINDNKKNKKKLKVDLMTTVNLDDSNNYHSGDVSTSTDESNNVSPVTATHSKAYYKNKGKSTIGKTGKLPKEQIMGGSLYEARLKARKCIRCGLVSCYVLIPIFIIIICLALFGARPAEFEVTDIYLKNLEYKGADGKVRGDIELTASITNPNFFDIRVEQSDIRLYYPEEYNIGFVSFPGTHLVRKSTVEEVLNLEFEDAGTEPVYQIIVDSRERHSEMRLNGNIVARAHVGIITYLIKIKLSCLLEYSWTERSMTRTCDNTEHVTPSLAFTYKQQKNKGGKADYGDELIEESQASSAFDVQASSPFEKLTEQDISILDTMVETATEVTIVPTMNDFRKEKKEEIQEDNAGESYTSDLPIGGYVVGPRVSPGGERRRRRRRLVKRNHFFQSKGK